ncbi:hypothetical protein GCM10027591_03250 [Zhihengliuella somnathii]
MSTATVTSGARALEDRLSVIEQQLADSHGPVLSSLVPPFELAERLGTTERTLSEWRIRGTGPAFIRVGRGVRYRADAIDAWLLEQERHSTSEEVY